MSNEKLENSTNLSSPLGVRGNYLEHLCRPLSKRFVDYIVMEIFANPSDFDFVYKLIFDASEKVAWRAAWACQKISEKHPEWFTNKRFLELALFTISTSHGGLQRGCLSILNNIPLPDPIPVDFLNACFEWMISSKSLVAVQVLSMKMVHKICKVEPDFRSELIAYLENMNFEDYSPGFECSRNNILKALSSK